MRGHAGNEHDWYVYVRRDDHLPEGETRSEYGWVPTMVLGPMMVCLSDSSELGSSVGSSEGSRKAEVVEVLD